MSDTSYDSAALAQLSSQLQSLGFIKGPLDLISLFVAPARSDSASAIAKHQANLVHQTKAREQVVRCLWSMLTARNESQERFESIAQRESVLAYELERTHGLLTKEKKQKQICEKEREKETARAQEAMKALTNERERHQHTKDELLKAKSALQAVKTQAQYDQKRREGELTATMNRLQRMTSDPAQSKLIVLNAYTTSSSHNNQPSAAKHRMRNSSAPWRPETPSSETNSSLEAAEISFLQSALTECDKERAEFYDDNAKLRELLGEIVEWSETVLDLPGVKGIEQEIVAEAVEAEKSFEIPSPHLSLPITELAVPLHNKLYQIRVGVQSLVDTAQAQLQQVRNELEIEINGERAAKESEQLARAQAEKDLETAQAALQETESLLKKATSENFLAGGKQFADESDDEVDYAKPKPPTAFSETAAKSSSAPPAKLKTLAEIAAEAKTAAAKETERAQHVKQFLGDLGLDSPDPQPALTRNKRVRPEAPVDSASTASGPNQATHHVKRVKIASSSSSRESTNESAASRQNLAPLIEISEAEIPKLVSTHSANKTSRARNQQIPSALTEILSLVDSPVTTSSTHSSTHMSASSRNSAGKSLIAAAREKALRERATNSNSVKTGTFTETSAIKKSQLLRSTASASFKENAQLETTRTR